MSRMDRIDKTNFLKMKNNVQLGSSNNLRTHSNADICQTSKRHSYYHLHCIQHCRSSCPAFHFLHGIENSVGMGHSLGLILQLSWTKRFQPHRTHNFSDQLRFCTFQLDTHCNLTHHRHCIQCYKCS